MPRIIRTLFAALLALAIVPSLRAQQLLKPQSVRFDGTQEYSPDELSAVTGVKKGATYTADFLAQGAQKLMASGVFEKVSYKFDGADLIYLLSDSPDLYPVIIDRNLPLDPAQNPDARTLARAFLFITAKFRPKARCSTACGNRSPRCSPSRASAPP